jgi:hypothetical protein
VLGRQSLTSFVRGWDSVGFGRVPPNAALVVDAERSSEEVVVLDLLRPKLGPGRTVTFGAKALGHRPDGILQRIARGAHDPRTDRFGRVSLFIDPTGPPPVPPNAIALDFVFTARAGVGQRGNVSISNYPVNRDVDMQATQLAGVSVNSLGVALEATGTPPYNATVHMSVEVPNCATTPSTASPSSPPAAPAPCRWPRARPSRFPPDRSRSRSHRVENAAARSRRSHVSGVRVLPPTLEVAAPAELLACPRLDQPAADGVSVGRGLRPGPSSTLNRRHSTVSC